MQFGRGSVGTLFGTWSDVMYISLPDGGGDGPTAAAANGI